MYVGQPCHLHTTVPHRSERAGPEQCSGTFRTPPKTGNGQLRYLLGERRADDAAVARSQLGGGPRAEVKF